MASKTYIIIANLADHTGYVEGMKVKIIRTLPEDFFIVEGEDGQHWTCGEEELQEVVK